jgi:hypothetical protein
MRPLVVLAILLGFVVPGLLNARPKTLIVVLKWNPNEKQAIPVFEITGGIHRLSIGEIVDKRDKGTQIGANTEEKIIVPVTTTSDIGGFVREHVAVQLKAIGLDIQSADSGDRVLRCELIEFWVAEGERYLGSVRLKVTVTYSDGAELWSALVGGVSNRFGRSLKPDNYTESVSNATQDLAAHLVSAPGFRQALAKTP